MTLLMEFSLVLVGLIAILLPFWPGTPPHDGDVS